MGSIYRDQTMTDKNNNLIDLTFLREFCKADKEKMANYIHMFLESAPEQIEDMKEKAERGNWTAVKAVAHSLKPQVKFIGLIAAEPMIDQIESNAASDNPTKLLPDLLCQLEKLLEQSFNELIQSLVSLS